MGVLNWGLNFEKPVMIRTGELVLQPKKKKKSANQRRDLKVGKVLTCFKSRAETKERDLRSWRRTDHL